MTRPLSDEMQALIDALRAGIRLSGPVRVRGHWKGHDREAPWGLSDGRRANKISVDALAARGLILIEERGDGREARLKRGGRG